MNQELKKTIWTADSDISITSGNYDIKTRIAVKLADERTIREELCQNLIKESHAFIKELRSEKASLIHYYL